MEKKVILLVEDNPDDETLTTMALREQKVDNDVIVAHDGEEALEFLGLTGKNSGKEIPLPTLVLLDLKLPKVDGLEVLKRIRNDARTRLLPVIILTTSTEDMDLTNGYKHGANSYVRKPVNFNDFHEAIKQLGLYWLVINLNPPNR